MRSHFSWFVLSAASLVAASFSQAGYAGFVSAEGELVGTRSTANGTIEVIGTGDWDGVGDNGFEIRWAITETGDATYGWKYEYWFSGEDNTMLSKGLSHFVLQLSTATTLDDYRNWYVEMTNKDGVKTVNTNPSIIFNTVEGVSTPVFSETIQGVKFETTVDTGKLYFSFESTKSPVYGDFVAKDGKGTEAYNSLIFQDPLDYDSSWSGFIARPDGDGPGPDDDGDPVPEPASMALFGLGALGMGLIARRRRSTNEAAV